MNTGPDRQPKFLGFAGHRHVPDKAALAGAIRRELLVIREIYGPRLIAICSAAAGADLIFLKSCVDLRMPAIVILPFPEERFSEDFEDPTEWEMAEKLTGVALAKYVAPGGKAAPEAYQIVSRQMLGLADVFLFAWDGEAARGAGGTGETVSEAADTGLPSRIVDAGTFEARWAVPPDPARRARHGFPTRAELLDFLDDRLG